MQINIWGGTAYGKLRTFRLYNKGPAAPYKQGIRVYDRLKWSGCWLNDDEGQAGVGAILMAMRGVVIGWKGQAWGWDSDTRRWGLWEHWHTAESLALSSPPTSSMSALLWYQPSQRPCHSPASQYESPVIVVLLGVGILVTMYGVCVQQRLASMSMWGYSIGRDGNSIVFMAVAAVGRGHHWN
ncbi:hypothetical protein EV421DRAFT_1739797 [Armillaria borealis]|uniref:Uncharacterized protein n=1 Tax=Armillaria borealis TaxID=47425 RepID=A0AA39MJW3_9AGAR|nr:hypothetical protein EV421DRAFT_1739797 [Armillaria borealis]